MATTATTSQVVSCLCSITAWAPCAKVSRSSSFLSSLREICANAIPLHRNFPEFGCYHKWLRGREFQAIMRRSGCTSRRPPAGATRAKASIADLPDRMTRMPYFLRMRGAKMWSYAVILVLCVPPACGAYSVLTHETLIDSAWDVTIKPLLLKRFPGATPDELRTAHSYAYGGAVIQDMGYY